MQKPMSKLRVVLMVVLGLYELTGVIPSAEAVMTVKVAEVQNGVAVVQGGNAFRNAVIVWEGAQVTRANNGGNFSFQGVVPADWVGRLEDGVPADAIDVTLANCGPVSEAPAPVPQTGQTASYALRDDGDLRAGVAWPTPRFTDNGNGTVADHLTGLIWLQNADCDALRNTDWATAVFNADSLASGQCDLSDGSIAGDWRLPNVKELQSLIDFGQSNPALPPGHPVLRVRFNGPYWSSTTRADNQALAWYVFLGDGQAVAAGKVGALGPFFVWPVRGGN
jgi:Protein of unknown function (DUF1566)